MSNHPDSSDDSDTSFEDESRLCEPHSLGSPNGPHGRGVEAGVKRGRYNRVPVGAKKRLLDCYLAGGGLCMAERSIGLLDSMNSILSTERKRF